MSVIADKLYAVTDKGPFTGDVTAACRLSFLEAGHVCLVDQPAGSLAWDHSDLGRVQRALSTLPGFARTSRCGKRSFALCWP